MADNLPKPASRKEQYLAKIAGEDTEIPEKPESRVEQYLAKIAENGGGGGGGPTVVQTTGNSQSDVMSQDATTKLVYVNSNLNKINIRGVNGVDDSTGSYSIAIGTNAAMARSEGSVAIGPAAQVYSDGTYSVAIGNSAATKNNSRAVALGNAAEASNNNSVAIGTNAKTTRVGEVNVGANDSGRGYNNTNYRVIGGVHDPVDAHDAATKGYVDAQSGGGGDTVYSDKSTSNSSTGGAVYIGNLDSSQAEKPDPTVTDSHYKYFWALPSSNGDIPAENSVNILGEGAAISGINIGPGTASHSSNYYSIAIGLSASTAQSNAHSAIAFGPLASSIAENGIAIGRSAKVNGAAYTNSVALGSFSNVGRKGEVNIGTGGTNMGYNNTDYRVIGGVHDPVDAHDAATKGYVDANAGGSAVFYMSVNPFATASGVSLYSDSGLTTAVPASTFVQALRNCKSVFLVRQNGTDTERAQIVCSNTPNQDTASAYDDTYPTARYFDDNGNYIMMQSTTGDPTDTASFDIAT